MQKIDYLECKINEIINEVSELSNRCDELENKINGTNTTNVEISNTDNKTINSNK